MKLGGGNRLGLINSLMAKPKTIWLSGFHISMHDLRGKKPHKVVTLKGSE